MLVASGHAQILVPEEKGHSLNIGTLHAEPACGGVAQIMEAEVVNPNSLQNAGKSDADVGRPSLTCRRASRAKQQA